MTRSGSPVAASSLDFVCPESVMAVVALISVLIKLEVMSFGLILCDCAISASVRVRSTSVSLPSVAERRRRSRCWRSEASSERAGIRGEGIGEGLIEG